MFIVEQIAKNGLNTFQLLPSTDGVYFPILEIEAGLGICFDKWTVVEVTPSEFQTYGSRGLVASVCVYLGTL